MKLSIYYYSDKPYPKFKIEGLKLKGIVNGHYIITAARSEYECLKMLFKQNSISFDIDMVSSDQLEVDATLQIPTYLSVKITM